jgi:hypothetical protein
MLFMIRFFMLRSYCCRVSMRWRSMRCFRRCCDDSDHSFFYFVCINYFLLYYWIMNECELNVYECVCV